MKDSPLSENVKIAASQFIEEKEYWIEKLSGEPEASYFFYDYREQTAEAKRIPEEVSFTCSPGLVSQVTALSKGSDPKLHMILTAGLTALLARYTGSSDILVGTSIDRQDEQDKEMELVNTILPLRFLLNRGITFKELLLQVRATINQAIDNQNYPIRSLVYEHNVPMFDAALVLENLQDKKYLEPAANNLTFSFLRVSTGGHEVIQGAVEYNAVLYKRETIERIIHQFLRLLETALSHVDIRIAQIDLLTEDEKQWLKDYNNTRTDYPSDKTIVQLFEEQAAGAPEKIAVVSTASLTYRELNEKSNHLAHLLKEKGVQPGTIAAIMAHPSPETVIGILAILKAGAAFLPIDPDFPKERVRFMLQDSRARVLLSEVSEVSEDVEVIDLIKIIGPIGPIGPIIKRLPTDLCYIIYTSGSTGQPKGVMIEHRSVVNYTWWAAKQYVKGEQIAFPFYTSMAFDLTITSIFTPLITGNTIVVYRGEEHEFLIERIMEENRVGVVKVTPTHLKMIRERKQGMPTNIKRFIVGGEELETQLSRDIHENFNGNIEIYNEYGPTEAAVGCMIYRFNPQKNKGRSVPIGTPADNVGIHLLDKHGNPVPPGFVGEIHISGYGLARGYLNNPELTNSKFRITNKGENYPLSFSASQLLSFSLYRTGDLGRWAPDEGLEFLGRADHQVKIRGYRIELGEVENRLIKIEQVKEAVVVARDDSSGYKQLCAYYVPVKELAPPQLRDLFQRQMPEYMVPSYFVPMEKLPVTSNGKIDRKVLPDPQESVDTGVEYRSPRSEVERLAADIWADVLGAEKVGIDDGYFSLGGDSVRAIQIAAAFQQHQLKMEIADLFRYPTIAQLSPFITPLRFQVSQEPVEGDVPLTPIQHWFFEKDPAFTRPFNMSVLLHRPETFDTGILETVFQQLIEHHDALRMVYNTREDGRVSQFNRGITGPPLNLEVIDLADRSDWKAIVEETCQRMQQRVDITGDDYLIKPVLFKTPTGDFLLIAVHHLVIDAVSVRVLLEEFEVLYKGLHRGEPVQLPLKTTSFKEWSEKLYRHANSDAFLEELAYWQEVEQIPADPLPKDRSAARNKQENSREETVVLSKEETGKLLKQVHRAYNTEINDILLAALGLAFKQWAGMETVMVDLEGHGREEILENVDITRTVGWFTSLYPIAIDMKQVQDHDPGTLIKRTKEMLRRVPNKGIGYGMLKYLTAPEKKQGLSFQGKSSITFNYLGQFDEDIDTDFYRMADISQGDVISREYEREYTLEINGIIVGQTLTMAVIYNKEEYNRETVAALAEQYRQGLCQLIQHCVSKEETELTVSDLTSSDFDEQEMEEILEELEED